MEMHSFWSPRCFTRQSIANPLRGTTILMSINVNWIKMNQMTKFSSNQCNFDQWLHLIVHTIALENYFVFKKNKCEPLSWLFLGRYSMYPAYLAHPSVIGTSQRSPPAGSCAGNDPPALVAAAAAQRRPEPRHDAGDGIQTTKKIPVEPINSGSIYHHTHILYDINIL